MLENLESKILRVGRAIYRLPRLERIDGCDAVGLVRLKLFRRVLGGRPQRLRLAFQSRQAACRHHGEADFHLVLRRIHETPPSAQRAKLWLEVRPTFHTPGAQPPSAFDHPIATFFLPSRRGTDMRHLV